MPADQTRLLPHTALLPVMDRLCAVWDSPQPDATDFEHATHVALTVWLIALDGVDGHDNRDWQRRILAASQASTAQTIAQAIDDEVTWTLGNRPEDVDLIDDGAKGPLTVGQLINRLTMYLAITMNWPDDAGESPMLHPFQSFGRDYDALITGLTAGSARQPRLRSSAPVPIRRPRRVDITLLPRN